MNLEELKQAAEDKILKGLLLCEVTYNRKFEMPTIRYDLRGKAAGKARHSTWTIWLNQGLLLQEGQAFIDDTPLHELAHLIDFEVNPRHRFQQRRPHGYSWKAICIQMGHNPTRCHNFDTSNVSPRQSQTFLWVCTKCGTEMNLKSTRHNRMLSGKTKYRPKANRACQHTMEYRPVYSDSPIAAQTKAAQPKKTTRLVGTRKDQARSLLNLNKSRAENIQTFVNEIGMTPAGAGTYYQNFKSGKWV